MAAKRGGEADVNRERWERGGSAFIILDIKGAALPAARLFASVEGESQSGWERRGGGGGGAALFFFHSFPF